jgi:asparagine synthase (glutamine-hydrolysing)
MAFLSEIIKTMCGIAGAVFGGDPQSAESAVRSMLPAMARRGPDGEGLSAMAGASLGHRRLAILDLSPAGAQPMLSQDGLIGLVFNGCIYNFREVRAELEQRGCRFRSQCDTEVILEGYRAWGIDALMPRLRGMFAFAIWDQPLQKLTLVRDRLGVKPLVYRAWSENIAFASTAGALRLAGLAGELDPQSVLEYLEFGFVTDARSIFSGLRKLPPATILEWKNGKSSQRVYWTLPEFGQSRGIGFEEAVEETERLIIEAVRTRLISDVPVGSLLSGGIDSSLICWALSKLNADIQAFTVGAPGDPSDESEDARQIAGRLGVSHQIVNLDSDAPPPLEELVDAFSEPFGCTSALGMLRASQAVRNKATVLLTGDGGDDVFLGYSFFHNAWKAQRLARMLPPGSTHLWSGIRPMLNRNGRIGRAKNFLDYAAGGIGAYARVRDGLPYYQRRGILGEKLRGRSVGVREVPASAASAKKLVAELFDFQRRNHFGSEFLPKVDGATMYYSVEARSPLLDQSIWEFAAQIPAEVHFHGGNYKAILREIARRHIGPEVAFRRKQGFTIPVENWLSSQWSGRLEELRGDTLLTRQGWLEQHALAPVVDKALAAGKIPIQLWHLIVLEEWLRRQQFGSDGIPVHADRGAELSSEARDA